MEYDPTNDPNYIAWTTQSPAFFEDLGRRQAIAIKRNGLPIRREDLPAIMDEAIEHCKFPPEQGQAFAKGFQQEFLREMPQALQVKTTFILTRKGKYTNRRKKKS